MPYDRPLDDFNEENDLKNYKVWVLGSCGTHLPGYHFSRIFTIPMAFTGSNMAPE